MTIYRAKKNQTVSVWGGTAEVKAGELVAFASYPGEGWEEVGNGSHSGKESRVVVKRRDDDDSDEAGV